jgi:hypothetical protein
MLQLTELQDKVPRPGAPQAETASASSKKSLAAPCKDAQTNKACTPGCLWLVAARATRRLPSSDGPHSCCCCWWRSRPRWHGPCCAWRPERPTTASAPQHASAATLHARQQNASHSQPTVGLARSLSSETAWNHSCGLTAQHLAARTCAGHICERRREHDGEHHGRHAPQVATERTVKRLRLQAERVLAGLESVRLEEVGAPLDREVPARRRGVAKWSITKRLARQLPTVCMYLTLPPIGSSRDAVREGATMRCTQPRLMCSDLSSSTNSKVDKRRTTAPSPPRCRQTARTTPRSTAGPAAGR